MKNVSRHQHDKNRYSRIATVDSCFALLGARQHCVAKICNASQIANLNKLQNDPFTISSSVFGTHLRPETSPKKGETAVHCCDPAISVLVMLVSRNVFHVVSALQSIVCHYPITGNTMPTWEKMIHYLRIKNLKNYTLFSETTRHFLKTCFDRNFCNLQFKSVQTTELNI